MKKHPFLMTAVALIAIPAVSYGQMISNPTVTDITSSGTTTDTVDLSGNTAFAGFQSGTTGTTDLGNVGGFTAIISPGGAFNGNDSKILISGSPNFVGGGGGNGNGATSPTGASLTFSSKLFAPNESFSIYASDYDATANFTLSLFDPTDSFLLTSNTLTTGLFGSDGTTGQPGTGHSYGLVAFNVAGATTGDILQISDSVALNAGSYDNIGINGAFANEIVTAPEPSTWALMVGGLGLLSFLRHRRASTVI